MILRENPIIQHPGCAGCRKTCNWRGLTTNPEGLPQSKKRDTKGKERTVYRVDHFKCSQA